MSSLPTDSEVYAEIVAKLQEIVPGITEQQIGHILTLSDAAFNIGKRVGREEERILHSSLKEISEYLGKEKK